MLKSVVVFLKNIIKLLGFIVALPLSIPFIILGWAGILLGKFAEVSILIAYFPFYIGEYVRYFYYKCTLKKVGNAVTFKFGSFCQYRNTYIGDRVLIGYYNSLGEICIGNDVLIGGFVNFLSGTNQHAFSDPNKKINEQTAKGRKMIHVGSDVWIGSNSVIMNDVGNRCVIGAGSVLIHETENNSVYVGNPAKCIKKLGNQ